jgi:glucose-1-phosphate thymidylyltransferase
LGAIQQMRVIILSAGYGTRLYPLTLNLPKALIPINSRPLINFLMEKLKLLRKYHPIKEVIIVSNNKFYRKFLRWKKKYKISVNILNDGSNTPKDRLGAVKDIKFAIGRKKGNWLIIGADNLFEDDLLGFLEFATKRIPYPSIGIYDVKNKKEARRFGVVKISPKKRILELEEKPQKPSSTLIATCIYFFPQECVRFLDLFLSKVNDADVVGKYIRWLVEKSPVFGYRVKGKWIDIGHLGSLKLAQKIFTY